ncbi:hypothetical protein VIGAN_10028600, partial [Vigna angularis var. angularis]
MPLLLGSIHRTCYTICTFVIISLDLWAHLQTPAQFLGHYLWYSFLLLLFSLGFPSLFFSCMPSVSLVGAESSNASTSSSFRLSAIRFSLLTPRFPSLRAGRRPAKDSPMPKS